MDLSNLKSKNFLLITVLISIFGLFLPWIGITFLTFSGFDIVTMNKQINGVYDSTCIYILLEFILFIGILFSMKTLIKKIISTLSLTFLLLAIYYILGQEYTTLKVGVIVSLIANIATLSGLFSKTKTT